MNELSLQARASTLIGLRLEVRVSVPASFLGPTSPGQNEQARLREILEHAVMFGEIRHIRDIGRQRRDKQPLTMPDGTTLMLTPGRGRYPDTLAKIAGTGKPKLVKWVDGQPQLVDNPDYKPQADQ